MFMYMYTHQPGGAPSTRAGRRASERPTPDARRTTFHVDCEIPNMSNKSSVDLLIANIYNDTYASYSSAEFHSARPTESGRYSTRCSQSACFGMLRKTSWNFLDPYVFHESMVS